MIDQQIKDLVMNVSTRVDKRALELAAESIIKMNKLNMFTEMNPRVLGYASREFVRLWEAGYTNGTADRNEAILT